MAIESQQFLTQLDPNARVKGSRDASGTLGLWSGFGRRVVGNLTTQSTSLSDFRMLVLGSWLLQEDDDPTAAFLAWEQLCGHARASAGDTGFRGVTRVQRCRQDIAAVRISGDRSAQILTNQAMYGVWGLYRAASWRCGLLNREAPRARPRFPLWSRESACPDLLRAGGGRARPVAHLGAQWTRAPTRHRPCTAN
jgi:hypothetical protein